MAHFLFYLAACVVLTLAPGPDILYVITKGLENGRKTAIATAWGMCSGCWVHTFAVAFGVSALCTRYPIVKHLLQVFGAAYLFYLTYATLRAPKAHGAPDADVTAVTDTEIPFGTAFRRGVLMNLLNPKVLFFFIIFLPTFVVPDSDISARVQLILLGSVFFVQGVILFSGVAWFAGSIGGFFRHSQTFNTAMHYISALVLAAIAIGILVPLVKDLIAK